MRLLPIYSTPLFFSKMMLLLLAPLGTLAMFPFQPGPFFHYQPLSADSSPGPQYSPNFFGLSSQNYPRSMPRPFKAPRSPPKYQFSADMFESILDSPKEYMIPYQSEMSKPLGISIPMKIQPPKRFKKLRLSSDPEDVIYGTQGPSPGPQEFMRRYRARSTPPHFSSSELDSFSSPRPHTTPLTTIYARPGQSQVISRQNWQPFSDAERFQSETFSPSRGEGNYGQVIHQKKKLVSQHDIQLTPTHRKYVTEAPEGQTSRFTVMLNKTPPPGTASQSPSSSSSSSSHVREASFAAPVTESINSRTIPLQTVFGSGPITEVQAPRLPRRENPSGGRPRRPTLEPPRARESSGWPDPTSAPRRVPVHHTFRSEESTQPSGFRPISPKRPTGPRPPVEPLDYGTDIITIFDVEKNQKEAKDRNGSNPDSFAKQVTSSLQVKPSSKSTQVKGKVFEDVIYDYPGAEESTFVVRDKDRERGESAPSSSLTKADNVPKYVSGKTRPFPAKPQSWLTSTQPSISQLIRPRASEQFGVRTSPVFEKPEYEYEFSTNPESASTLFDSSTFKPFRTQDSIQSSTFSFTPPNAPHHRLRGDINQRRNNHRNGNRNRNKANIIKPILPQYDYEVGNESFDKLPSFENRGNRGSSSSTEGLDFDTSEFVTQMPRSLNGKQNVFFVKGKDKDYVYVLTPEKKDYVMTPQEKEEEEDIDPGLDPRTGGSRQEAGVDVEPKTELSDQIERESLVLPPVPEKQPQVVYQEEDYIEQKSGQVPVPVASVKGGGLRRRLKERREKEAFAEEDQQQKLLNTKRPSKKATEVQVKGKVVIVKAQPETTPPPRLGEEEEEPEKIVQEKVKDDDEESDDFLVIESRDHQRTRKRGEEATTEALSQSPVTVAVTVAPGEDDKDIDQDKFYYPLGKESSWAIPAKNNKEKGQKKKFSILKPRPLTSLTVSVSTEKPTVEPEDEDKLPYESREEKKVSFNLKTPKWKLTQSTTTSTTPSLLPKTTTTRTTSKPVTTTAIPVSEDKDIDDDEWGDDGMSGIPGVPNLDYPTLAEVPENIDFSCKGRPPGYYADVAEKCQVYHHCSERGHQAFLCPNGTLFNQASKVCTWWYTVNCEDSAQFYEKPSQKTPQPQTRKPKKREDPVGRIEYVDEKQNEKQGTSRGSLRSATSPVPSFSAPDPAPAPSSPAVAFAYPSASYSPNGRMNVRKPVRASA